MLLDLIGANYQVIDVPYGDRTELAELSGGYIQVPVLVTDKVARGALQLGDLR